MSLHRSKSPLPSSSTAAPGSTSARKRSNSESQMGLAATAGLPANPTAGANSSLSRRIVGPTKTSIRKICTKARAVRDDSTVTLRRLTDSNTKPEVFRREVSKATDSLLPSLRLSADALQGIAKLINDRFDDLEMRSSPLQDKFRDEINEIITEEHVGMLLEQVRTEIEYLEIFLNDHNYQLPDHQPTDSSPNAVVADGTMANIPPNAVDNATASLIQLPNQDTRIRIASDTPPITVSVKEAENINKALINELQQLHIQVDQANQAKSLETNHRLQMEADYTSKIHKLMEEKQMLERAHAPRSTTASHEATAELPRSTQNASPYINSSLYPTQDTSNRPSTTENMLANIMTAVNYLTTKQEQQNDEVMLRTSRLEQLMGTLATAETADSSEPLDSYVEQFENYNANEEQDYPRSAHPDSKSRGRSNRRSRSRSHSPKADRHSSHDLKLNLDFSVKFMEQFTGSENFEAFIQSFEHNVLRHHKLTDSTKFSILCNKLAGEARDCVSHTSDRATAIAETLENLESVYGKRTDKHTLLAKLRSLPFSQTDPEKMKINLIAHKVLLKQLQHKGITDTDERAKFALTVKLPPRMRDNLHEYMAEVGDNVTQKQVLERIEKCIEARRLSNTIMGYFHPEAPNEIPTTVAMVNHVTATTENSQNTNGQSNPGKTSYPPTYDASKHPVEYFDPVTKTSLPGYFAPGTKGVNIDIIHRSFPFKNEEKVTCAACGGTHNGIRCPLSSVEFRRLLTAKKLCPICTGKHEIQSCRSKFNCGYCDGAHHMGGCPRKEHFRDMSNYPSTAKPAGTPVITPVPPADWPTANTAATEKVTADLDTATNNPHTLPCHDPVIPATANPGEAEIIILPNIEPTNELVSRSALNNNIRRFAAFVSRLEPPHSITIAQDSTAINDRLTFVRLTTARGQTIRCLVDTGASLSLITHGKAKQLAPDNCCFNCSSRRKNEFLVVGLGVNPGQHVIAEDHLNGFTVVLAVSGNRRGQGVVFIEGLAVSWGHYRVTPRPDLRLQGLRGRDMAVCEDYSWQCQAGGTGVITGVPALKALLPVGGRLGRAKKSGYWLGSAWIIAHVTEVFFAWAEKVTADLDTATNNPHTLPCHDPVIPATANPGEAEIIILPNIEPTNELVSRSALNNNIRRFAAFVSRLEPPHSITIAQDSTAINDRLTFVRLTTARGQTIRCLVDTGASLSLITHGKAKQLALEVLHETIVQINGFTVIRTKYWIPHDAVVVNRVIGKCVPCKRVNGLPFAYPYSSVLPNCRTTPSKPFSKVGLDYMGPLSYIRDDGTYGTVHVLIYTCLTTRATMLRVVPDNTALKYILTLKMIFREVGVPTDIYSDNALSFLLGAKVMSRDITAMESSQTLTAFLANQDITYRRITPLAPWQGGIYERVVGLVKHQLDKETRARVLDYHSLLYLVSGAQAMVNNRPLIPHSRKPGDLIALRPIDFLLPGVMLEIPTNPSPPGLPPGSTEATLRQHLEKLEESLEHMWKIWSVGYLNFLREALHKNRRCSLLLPKVGQLVIIYTNLIKRHKWPLGLIVEVHESPRDGAIRSATVLCCGKRLTRPVCHLIPLEVETLYRQTDPMSSDTDSSNHQPSTSASSNPEPTRLPLPTPATLDTSTKVAPEMFPENIMPNIAEARPDRGPRSTGPNPTASMDDHEEFQDFLEPAPPLTAGVLPRDPVLPV
ncbi:unnamed protein product [Caenorhabditis nigoni]